MRYSDLIPLATSNGSAAGNRFVAAFANSCRKAQHEEDQWISNLRNEGVKAAHPDDGWVNREENSVTFCYPQFNDGVKVGDRICLGWPDKFRIVTVHGLRETIFGDMRYLFQ